MRRFYTIECIYCKKVVNKRMRETQTICSRSCWAKSIGLGKFIRSPEWRKKKSEEAKNRKGENAYRWIKDRTKIVKRQIRNDSSYKAWRMEVYKRDNFRCRIANKDCGGRIESHHILVWSEYPELRYEVNNGITLCHAHHPRKRAEEKQLVPYFIGLVETKV